MAVLVMMLLLFGGSYSFGSRTIKVTWEELPSLKLPSLSNHPNERIGLKISQVPVGAYVKFNDQAACSQLCSWSFMQFEPGVMLVSISNNYGYAPAFDTCLTPIQIEFGTRVDHQQNLHCTLSFVAIDTRFPPKYRVGDVVILESALGDSSGDTNVFIYPQIEIVHQRDSWKIPIRPNWSATIEAAGIEKQEVFAWDDWTGLMTKSPRHSAPPQVAPILKSALKRCNGVVRISFNPNIYDLDVPCALSFESSILSFNYDVFHQRIVPE